MISDLDFTVQKYKKLCRAISRSEYKTLTLAGYFQSSCLPRKFMVLRHDVDRMPLNALHIAKIEKEHGIKASFYFRSTAGSFKPELMREVERMGHEVGYHYEVLSKAKGDHKKAISMFKQELEAFRKVCDITTICMHGSPLSKYDNRDLWKAYGFRQFGITGEAYLSAGKDLCYLSDTGRTWGHNHKVRDVMHGNISNVQINSTDELIGLIGEGEVDRLYVVVHPERWSESLAGYVTRCVVDSACNMGKRALVMVRR